MLVGAILFVALGAYLMGSFPTGYLMGRAKGLDIRAHGSGNIGATNAFRLLGKPAGTLVLVADALKGALSVLVLPVLAERWWPGPGLDPVILRMVASLGAVLGHNYTCWLRFRGGKGIATSAGVLAALVPYAFLITLAVFLTILAASRYVSLASILAAAALPAATWITLEPLPVLGLTFLLSMLALWRHRPNMRRLLAGTEHRIGSSRPRTAI